MDSTYEISVVQDTLESIGVLLAAVVTVAIYIPKVYSNLKYLKSMLGQPEVLWEPEDY
jgi:hypothetical protein